MGLLDDIRNRKSPQPMDEYGTGQSPVTSQDGVNRLIQEMQKRASASDGPAAGGGPASAPTPAPSQPTLPNASPAPPAVLPTTSPDATSSTASAPTPPSPRPSPIPVGGQGDGLLPAPRTIQMPDINSMPATARMNKVQGDLDATMHPPGADKWLGSKGKLMQLGVKLAPQLIGLATGARPGAVAAGQNQADLIANKQKEERIGDLSKDLGQLRSQQEGQYTGALRANEMGVQMDNNRLLREMMVNGQNKRAEGRDTTSLAIHGLHADGTPMTEEELPPQIRTSVMLKRSQDTLVQAQTELAKARAAGIPQQIQVAQDRLKVAQQNHQLSSRRFEAEYYGTDNGQPIPGMPMQDGGVIGPKAASATGPTSATKTKMAQADAIKSVSDPLVAEIRANANLFGPGKGRWTNFETFVGDQSPAAQHLKASITSYTALHPQLHGFRGTGAMKEFFNSIGGFPTNAEAAAQGVESMTENAGRMKDAWQGGSVDRVPPRAGGVNAKSPKGGGKGQGEVINMAKDKNGRYVPVTSGASQ